MLIAACVLLAGALLERGWLSAIVWTVAIVLSGVALRRRLQHAA